MKTRSLSIEAARCCSASPEDTVWVHRDLAGTSWSERDQPHQIEGATGAATRTVIALAERLAGGVQ